MRRVLDSCPFLSYLSTASDLRAGFLSLSAIDVLGWIVVCGGGGGMCTCACAFCAVGDVGQYPWPRPTLDATSTPHSLPLDIAKCPLGCKMSAVENHWVGGYCHEIPTKLGVSQYQVTISVMSTFVYSD